MRDLTISLSQCARYGALKGVMIIDGKLRIHIENLLRSWIFQIEDIENLILDVVLKHRVIQGTVRSDCELKSDTIILCCIYVVKSNNGYDVIGEIFWIRTVLRAIIPCDCVVFADAV